MEQSRRTFLRWLGVNGVGVAALPTLLSETASAATDITVLANATVIDGTGAPARENVTLVLVDGRISWTGNGAQMPKAEGAKVIDLRGKYVMPGLWDMHTHFGFDDQITVPLHVANGVTSVREMWGFPEIHAIRDRVNRNQLVGPRFTIASTIIDGEYSVWSPDSTEVKSAEQARAAVRAAKAGKADFIKIYTYLNRDSFLALTDEARKLGLPVVGHQPARLRVSDAIGAGMKCFEHLYSMPTATSNREDAILRQLNSTPVNPENPRAYYNLIRNLDIEASRSHNPGKAAVLYDKMAKAGAWQSPTLTVLRVMSMPAETYANDPRLKYIAKSTKDFWAVHVQNFAPRTPEEIAKHREYLKFQLKMVGDMAKAGVRLIGGTDAPNPYVFPGFAAHDELALLVEAGLTPLRAIQTMTGEAASFLGLDRTMGTVNQGKVADLLVLDANPLADIRNTQKINSIFNRGKLITSAQRTKMLADVEAIAKASKAAARPAQPFCGCHS